jgi:AcrR family transcriptional regulator
VNIADRRTLRTRQLLLTALRELMHTHRYESISVSEIAERANVGRSTFYAHYVDKDDLFATGVREMVSQLEQDEPGLRNTLSPSLGLFHHVAEAQGLYPSFAHGRYLDLFLTNLQAELAALLLRRLAPRVSSPATVVPPPVLADMLAGMLLSAVRSWSESDPRPPAEEVNRSFVLCAEAAIRAGLKPSDSVPGPPVRS